MLLSRVERRHARRLSAETDSPKAFLLLRATRLSQARFVAFFAFPCVNELKNYIFRRRANASERCERSDSKKIIFMAAGQGLPFIR